MIDVQLSTGSGARCVLSLERICTVRSLREKVEQSTGLQREDFYVVRNGRLLHEEENCADGRVTVVPRLRGGKGGFGSMLRAIGAQIEKTTNREACRDLSGRRLRDINEEKRLKAWIEKQAKREEEAAERKKRKLERLCTEPRHEFKDQGYERERSVLTERVGDAVEEGFKAASAVSSGTKRKHEPEAKPAKRKTLLDLEIDSDELASSDESGEDEAARPKRGKLVEREATSNDSGHSSDEAGMEKETETQDSEASLDCQNHVEGKDSTSADANPAEDGDKVSVTQT